MVMYEKTYKAYFDPSDDQVHTFRLLLELSTYGAIGGIRIEDAGSVWSFSIGPNGCILPPGFHLTNNKVVINDLPSGVQLEFTCVFPKTPNERWDVTQLIE